MKAVRRSGAAAKADPALNESFGWLRRRQAEAEGIATLLRLRDRRICGCSTTHPGQSLDVFQRRNVARSLLRIGRMPPPRECVYVLRSERDPRRYYTGITSDLEARLSAHNAGLSTHSATGRPWRVVVSVQFTDAARAADFEAYLKTGSGRAFARRHFR